MDKVIPLQKIKWTVILKPGNNFAIFAQSLEKLLASVHVDRTELFLLPTEDQLFLNTFSTLCEKAKISYNHVDNNYHASSISRGDYLVFITDHTLPSKNFLQKLTFCMENYDKTGKVAVVAPISNDSYPRLGITPANVDLVQSHIAKTPKNNIPWTNTINLSPYCLMFRKSNYVDLPLKDLILDTLYNGYYQISANDTVVYHFPEDIDFRYSVYDNLDNNKNLAILYRIKVDDEYTRDVFVKSLSKSAQITNNIYILDDNSSIKIALFLKENTDLWDKITRYTKFSRPYDERRDYNELLSWAIKDNCGWALALEEDEILEDKVTTEYLQKLLDPVNPEIMAYKVSHYYMWDTEDQWRFDPPWGKMADVRLARVIPNRLITKEGLITAQSGYVPHFPEECVKDSSLRIQNFGYITKKDREDKQAFYNKLNLKVGNSTVNFNHMTNVNGAYFYPWVENKTLSVYVPTNKGGNLLYNWLEHVSYFADEVVIGNDNNLLKTEDLELISKYKNVKVVPTVMGDNYGEGRNTLLEACTCDYILQLDIDERINDLMPLRRVLDYPGYEAWMFTIPNVQPDGGEIITETIRLFKNEPGIRYSGRLHETIDNYVKQHQWKISKSPVNIIHYGYSLQTPDEAFKKMTKYLETNLKQMKENPMYGMTYYNIALHFLEDDLVEDAIRLLNLCVTLQGGFPLASLELTKTHLKMANKWMAITMRGLPQEHPMKIGFSGLQSTLQQIQPKNYIIAKGHCLAYFGSRPKEAEWLKNHIDEMEKKIAEFRTRQGQK